MAAVTHNITVEQGATYVDPGFWWYEPAATPEEDHGAARDLTGWSARMEVRVDQQQPVLIEATDANGCIYLGGDTGRVDIKLPAELTAKLGVRRAKYDLELVAPNGDVFRVLEGRVTVTPNITQPAGDPVLT